jgi:hypothetical protein
MKYFVVWAQDFGLEYLQYGTRQEAFAFLETLLLDGVDADKIMIFHGNTVGYTVEEHKHYTIKGEE